MWTEIKDIFITIYNRWGAVVFETTNPSIKWNGKRNNDGQDVPEGTYFYICTVHILNQPADSAPIKLHGTIQLLRNGVSKQNN